MSDWKSLGMDQSPRSLRGSGEGYTGRVGPAGPYGDQRPPAYVGERVDGPAFSTPGGLPSVSQQTPGPRPSIASPPQGREQLHRFVGLGVGLASVTAEHILSHPCIVLRRQCQVHTNSYYYHTTPFTLFQTIFNLNRHQSVSTLWKGLGSSLMVKGMAVASETAISEFTPFPREITRHSSIKKLVQHLLLKGMTFLLITPFYAASLVESVQSEKASERPGVFDCLREGARCLMTLTQPQMTRRLPVWKLFGPMLFYGVLHYIIASLAQYTVLLSVRSEIREVKAPRQGEEKSVEQSLYEAYYPELVATFTGNLLADTLLYPLETILHRLCLQGTRTIIDNTDNGLDVIPIQTRYQGMVDCLQSIISDEGFAGLFKGFGALILQYALHAAILRLTKMMFRYLMDSAREAKDNNLVWDREIRMLRQPTGLPPHPR